MLLPKLFGLAANVINLLIGQARPRSCDKKPVFTLSCIWPNCCFRPKEILYLLSDDLFVDIEPGYPVLIFAGRHSQLVSIYRLGGALENFKGRLSDYRDDVA